MATPNPTMYNLYTREPVKDCKFERQVQGEYLYSSQDIYVVNGQGISGVIMPFSSTYYTLFDGSANGLKAQYQLPAGSQTEEFRFLGDQGANKTTWDPNDPTGNYDKQMITGRIGGKKTEPIMSSSGKITGFIVTDIDGKIYEYKQPVWNGYQYNWSQNTNSPVVTTYMELKTPYAGNWLLTAVKGPDYVDRNSNGVDANDWGYWVKFTYASSVPQIWRSPFSGNAPGTSSDQTVMWSYGARDIVYLDKVETATHLAKFIKSTAKDRIMGGNTYPVKGWEYGSPSNYVTFRIGGNLYDQIRNRMANGETHILSVGTWYHQKPSPGCLDCSSLFYWYVNKENVGNLQYADGVTSFYCFFQQPYNDGLYDYDFSSVANGDILLDCIVGQEKGSSIGVSQKLDRVDLYNKNDLVHPIKSVHFNYDYTLCPSTPNSSATAAADGADGGKMTLKSVQVFGQNNTAAMPPFEFSYANGDAPGTGLNPQYNVDDWDMWGSYRDPADRGTYVHDVPQQDKERADKAAAWSLTKIITPLGSTLDVEYEADDYNETVAE